MRKNSSINGKKCIFGGLLIIGIMALSAMILMIPSQNEAKSIPYDVSTNFVNNESNESGEVNSAVIVGDTSIPVSEENEGVDEKSVDNTPANQEETAPTENENKFPSATEINVGGEIEEKPKDAQNVQNENQDINTGPTETTKQIESNEQNSENSSNNESNQPQTNAPTVEIEEAPIINSEVQEKPEYIWTYPDNPDDWVPPPPGVGLTLVGEGEKCIPVNIDDEKLHSFGNTIGGKLRNAGYTMLYPNAGEPMAMVKDAVENYANTGVVKLNPKEYDLPELVGEYHAKIEVNATNCEEAIQYIFEYMKNDVIFNDKVKTVFATGEAGSLQVYQKDGYFYVLYATIDVNNYYIGQ